MATLWMIVALIFAVSGGPAVWLAEIVVCGPEGALWHSHVAGDANGRIATLYPVRLEFGPVYTVWAKPHNALAESYTFTVRGSTEFRIGAPRYGDLDGDNHVTVQDFSLFIQHFGSRAGQARYWPAADFNGDSYIGVGDFSLLAASFDQQGAVMSCSASASAHILH